MRRVARSWAAVIAAALPCACPALAAPEAGGAASGAVGDRIGEARTLQQRGSFAEAKERYDSVIAELRASGASTSELGAALVGLSQIAAANGDFATAVARGREAAHAYREARDTAGESRALNAAAVAEVYRGEFERGLADLDRALALSRAAGDREAEVEQLNNTGTAFFLQARYLDAVRAFRAAEDLVDAAGGAPWQARRRRLTVSNLAAVFQRLGAYDRALELYRGMQDSPDALAPSEQARLLTNLGALYRRLEDPLKALETYSAAQRLFARDRHRDGEIGVLRNIGIVQALDLENPSAALQAFSAALALAEQGHDARQAMQAHLYRGETLLRLGDLDAAARDLGAALASAEALGTAEERWKALYALGRVERLEGRDAAAAARFREAIAAIESVRAGLQLSALRTDFLADKRDVYDALVDLLAGRGDVAEVFHLLERSRARDLQDRLRERSPGGGAAPATLAAVQARLEPGTLLLEFWYAATGAGVVWATREASGMARIADPPTAAELSALGQELSTGNGDGWRRGASAIGARLLAGVEPLSRPGVRHIVVVPDGPLAAIPLEVLGTPGDGAIVLERYDVSYAPSASIVLRDPPPGRATLPWERRLLAFGDPVVSRDGRGSAADEVAAAPSPERLPSSAEEVRAIAGLVRGARAELHLGVADQKKYLLQGRARGVPLLHLGTHATADDLTPERSRILFSPGDGTLGADYLFLKEVYDLDLRGVDLATLSACETERGKEIRGEGPQAFSRALLSAGARASVTTLWRVADRPTAELMKQFYFELGRGAPKAEALRQAKLRFLRSGSPLAHPRFWAAFVLNGDGLRPIPGVFPPRTLVTSLLALVLAASLATLARSRRRGPAPPRRRRGAPRDVDQAPSATALRDAQASSASGSSASAFTSSRSSTVAYDPFGSSNDAR